MKKKILKIYLERYNKSNIKRKKPKFKVGETVRIWGERGKFHRGYMEDFAREFFTISKVYIVKEENDEKIVGTFFEDELVKYIPNDNYQIRVLKQRKTKNGLEYLVNYIGWPDRYNEWTPARDIDGWYYTIGKLKNE